MGLSPLRTRYLLGNRIPRRDRSKPLKTKSFFSQIAKNDFSAPGGTNGLVSSTGWRVTCIPNLVEGPIFECTNTLVNRSNQWMLRYRKRTISHPSISRLQISHMRTQINRERVRPFQNSTAPMKLREGSPTTDHAKIRMIEKPNISRIEE